MEKEAERSPAQPLRLLQEHRVGVGSAMLRKKKNQQPQAQHTHQQERHSGGGVGQLCQYQTSLCIILSECSTRSSRSYTEIKELV